ncbi:hypothetical protein CHS0354_032533, partial [Potamilus streckersoni]
CTTRRCQGGRVHETTKPSGEVRDPQVYHNRPPKWARDRTYAFNAKTDLVLFR